MPKWEIEKHKGFERDKFIELPEDKPKHLNDIDDLLHRVKDLEKAVDELRKKK